MAANRWRGDGAAVAQVDANTFSGLPLPGDVAKVSISNKAVSYSSLDAVMANFCAGLAAALTASTIPEFTEAAWIAASPVVNGTATVAGVPFTATIALTLANLAVPVQGAAVLAAGGTLTAATQLFYVVTATNASGETTASNEKNATPTGSTLSVTLSWAVIPGATGYKVYRGTVTATENKLIATIADGTATGFTDDGATGVTASSPPGSNTATIVVPTLNAATLAAGGSLTAATPYYYVLTATNGAGETVKSNEVTATPSGGNLSIVNTWTAISGATGYKLYRSTTSGTYTTPALLTTIVSGATVTFTDTGSAVGAGAPPVSNTATLAGPTQTATSTNPLGGALAAGTYYYELTTLTAAGESTVGNEKSQVTLGAQSSVTLSWGAITGATGYHLYRGTSASGENVLVAIIGSGATVTFADEGETSTSASPPGSNTALSTLAVAKTTPTASAGPNDWSTAANWSTGSVPGPDDITLELSDVPIYYGLDQHSVTATTYQRLASYTGQLGLPDWNPLGYFEYRTKALTIAITNGNAVTLGAGPGSGPSLERYNFYSSQPIVTVFSTGTSSDQGIEALQITGTASGAVLYARSGSIGLAVTPGDTTNFSTADISFVDQPASDVVLRAAIGCTIGTLNMLGGDVSLYGPITTVKQLDGTLAIIGTQAVTTITLDSTGTFYWQTTGTLTTLSQAGAATVDCSRDMRVHTATTWDVYGGGIIDDNATTKGTANPVLIGIGIEDLKPLRLGKGFTLTLS